MLAEKKGKLLSRLSFKLFKANDSGQRIALGLGLGVFTGILPGTGPFAALFLASIFRLNRASALLGSLVTNTWLSFVTFLLAVKAGSYLLGIDWQTTRQEWGYFLKTLSWKALFKISVLKVILPVVTGYLLVAFCLGLVTYLAALLIIKFLKPKRKSLPQNHSCNP